MVLAAIVAVLVVLAAIVAADKGGMIMRHIDKERAAYAQWRPEGAKAHSGAGRAYAMPASDRHAHSGASRKMRTGMTLIEVMIAVAILTAVMGLGWGSYATAVNHQQRMQDINERLHGVEQAVNRIVRDMSTAFITKHGDDDSQTEIRYKTGFLGEEDRVDFTSMGYVRMFRDEKVGDQSEISYFVRNMRNEDGELVNYLVRREQAPINDDFEKGGTILPLLEGVLSFRLEYWDDSKADVSVGSDGWVESWDTEHSDYQGRLPSRVKIEIEIEDPLGSDEPMLISTQAQIHLTTALEF